MRASVSHQGIFNLNRFQINIKQTKNAKPVEIKEFYIAGAKIRSKEVLISEYKLKDLLIA